MKYYLRPSVGWLMPAERLMGWYGRDMRCGSIHEHLHIATGPHPSGTQPDQNPVQREGHLIITSTTSIV